MPADPVPAKVLVTGHSKSGKSTAVMASRICPNHEPLRRAETHPMECFDKAATSLVLGETVKITVTSHGLWGSATMP